MSIQYVTDDAGHKLAVLIPYEEWELIASRLEFLEPNEETAAAMEEGREPGKLKAYTTPDALWADLEAD
ncbi:MAG: hypothetical protein ACLGQW_11155 [Acidobacteriota bacterium]